MDNSRDKEPLHINNMTRGEFKELLWEVIRERTIATKYTTEELEKKAEELKNSATINIGY